MYTCICKAVPERKVREAADQGVTTLRELRQRLGVGSGCGKCVRSAYQVLRTAAARRPEWPRAGTGG